ncbi:MAG TPA: hypothetical protein VF794_21695 [Archangium sp.]|uniref:hypothetical protein n=1 Tax=Archangium sp. TaxID=1872627 RepID=UPI002ED91039
MSPRHQLFGACQERAGFLFTHDCPRSATQSCTRCAKSICHEHSRSVEEEVLCIECARTAAPTEPSGDDPYFYSSYYYRNYGFYGHGAWGSQDLHDPNDFTEADGEALRADRPGDFEEDMSGS